MPARVEDYESTWLDSCFKQVSSCGAGCDLHHGRRTAVPAWLSLLAVYRWRCCRVPNWLSYCSRRSPMAPPRLRANASVAYEVLSERGALFFQELQTLTGLLPSHLEAALRELAAVGLVTADGFAAVRSFVDATRGGRRHGRRGAATRRSASAAGRWSVFPGAIPAADRDSCVDRWCHVLLRRWGVVFRDLWYVKRPRRRGTNWCVDFAGWNAGANFAAADSWRVSRASSLPTRAFVERLRSLRGSDEADPWLVISAADPLNLTGVLTAAPRVPAVPTNSLILENGHFVAARQGRLVDCFSAR